jgi:hypothetical protein
MRRNPRSNRTAIPLGRSGVLRREYGTRTAILLIVLLFSMILGIIAASLAGENLLPARSVGVGAATSPAFSPATPTPQRSDSLDRMPPAGTPPATSRPPTPLALGAYVSPEAGDASDIDRFTALIGASPALVMWYQDWEHASAREFDPDRMNAVAQRGAMPVVTWEPWDSAGKAAQPAYSLARILGGTYDPYIRRWARGAATWGHPMYLRFAHEMNANWYPWSAGTNGNTSNQYVEAWRHVWDIFHQEGASNIRWIWSPYVEVPGDTSYAQLYPGDRYVDWIALDGYNWGASQPWSQWMDLSAIFDASYLHIGQLTGKPMMIAEIACAEAGGDKAAWITRGLLTDVPTRFPRIRAVIWFDVDKETDWRVDSSASSLAAFKVIAGSPLYHGRLP